MPPSRLPPLPTVPVLLALGVFALSLGAAPYRAAPAPPAPRGHAADVLVDPGPYGVRPPPGYPLSYALPAGMAAEGGAVRGGPVPGLLPAASGRPTVLTPDAPSRRPTPRTRRGRALRTLLCTYRL